MLELSSEMTIKLLEPERFKEIPAPINQEFAQVVVIEDDDGTIKGYAVAQPICHLEPIWVDESLRGTIQPIKLWAGALAAMRSIGVNLFYTQAATDEHADYLIRLGCKPLPYVPFEGMIPDIPVKEQ
jgi:hypothetical protein